MSLVVRIAILRVLCFLDDMYSHWEQCREVSGESVVCVNCYQTKFSLTQVIFFI